MRIEDKHGFARADLDVILRTHLIEPRHLRNDDFQAFFETRAEALVGLVSAAMDKPVVDYRGANETEIKVDDSPDEIFMCMEEYEETAK